ncbi:hypothetical protein ACFBZI_00805 [Moraxella sp. ZJ142]|uniref:hypothetical protein n=1 Tax=Moraxella marmotae TaxID=3344520 RepID=UPI0035D4455A
MKKSLHVLLLSLSVLASLLVGVCANAAGKAFDRATNQVQADQLPLVIFVKSKLFDAVVGGEPMLHFEDYHAKMEHQGAVYVLDSFVKPLEQPFYIYVRAEHGGGVLHEVAAELAVAYIEPKGCTEPLVRRADLDKGSADGQAWIIGVSC